MYVREWKCICPLETREGFIDYLHQTGVKDTQEIDQCQGFQILQRELEQQVEITLLTYWHSFSAMKLYAGDNLYKAVLYPQDDRYRIESDLEVKIYQQVATN